MERFQGKTALVTGGSSGIGRGIARRLAREGATVVIGDIAKDAAEKVVAEIGAGGGTARAIAFDAGDGASCAALVDAAVAVTGQLDVLVNNAGIMGWGRATEFPDDLFEKILRIDLFSVFWVSKRALPHLLKTKGTIVNMASAAALQGVPYSAAYCAAKAGVTGLTRSMAVEFAEEGVRVNAVCPGAVDTPLNAKAPIPEWADLPKVMRLAPKTGVSSTPDEIAAAVAYLASPEAANVTGISFSIDGGQAAG